MLIYTLMKYTEHQVPDFTFLFCTAPPTFGSCSRPHPPPLPRSQHFLIPNLGNMMDGDGNCAEGG